MTLEFVKYNRISFGGYHCGRNNYTNLHWQQMGVYDEKPFNVLVQQMH